MMTDTDSTNNLLTSAIEYAKRLHLYECLGDDASPTQQLKAMEESLAALRQLLDDFEQLTGYMPLRHLYRHWNDYLTEGIDLAKNPNLNLLEEGDAGELWDGLAKFVSNLVRLEGIRHCCDEADFTENYVVVLHDLGIAVNALYDLVAQIFNLGFFAQPKHSAAGYEALIGPLFGEWIIRRAGSCDQTS